MSSERYRWRLVDEFVQHFNEHQVSHFTPSEVICVDESMSRWYRLGAFWLNKGLLQYIAIDRKSENGCEVQNSACGRSHIMLRVKLVKTAEAEDAMADEDSSGILHGPAVVHVLFNPWRMKNYIVCADSYFASVQAAESLMSVGLKFAGVIKTVTKRFQVQALAEKELDQRGDRFRMVYLDDDKQPKFLAFVWMYRNLRYFTSCSSSAPGKPYSRGPWWQVEDVSTNADPQLVEIEVTQAKAAEIYYDVCGAIVQHSSCRQDTLNLEKKLGTTDWDKRVNTSLFGMIVVDT